VNHLLITGKAGSGKTTKALEIAFKRTSTTGSKARVVIVRNVVPVRDIGFLPGELEDKTAPFFEIYQPLIRDLKKRKLKTHTRIDFLTTSFIRGRTLDDCVVILDEAQNLTYHEFESVLTRLGKKASLIVVGDGAQADNAQESDWTDVSLKYGSLPSVRTLELKSNFRNKLLGEWLGH